MLLSGLAMELSEQEKQAILEICLRSVIQHPEALEQVLSNFADQETWLRPELQAGIWLANQVHGLEPSPGFLARSLDHLLCQIRACQHGPEEEISPLIK